MRRLESAVAILLTAAAAWLHVLRFSAAGALWRDEVSAVNLATTGSLAEIPKLLHHEAFPLFFSLVVRTYTSIVGSEDAALRMFGLLVGLSLLAALWLSAWLLNARPPTIGLALVGVSASVVQWADWLRGHGLGMVLMSVGFALIWKVSTAPGRKVLILATLTAIASVHTLYFNTVLLAAAATAAAGLAIRERAWPGLLLVLALGGTAMLTMLPYLVTIRRAGDLSAIYEVPFSFELFWANLSSTLAAGSGIQWAWISLAAGALIVAAAWQLRNPQPQRHVSFYCGVALLLAAPAYFLFLKLLRYPTQPWYYVPLLSFTAVAIDGVFNTLRGRWWSAARIAVAVSIAGWSFVPVQRTIQTRQTNVDLAATKLEELSTAGDLIVVMPWYLGLTFNRYFNAPVEWVTVPLIADSKLQRYDLFKQQIEAADPLAPVRSSMEKVLRGGGRVWLVGQLLVPDSDEAPIAPTESGEGPWMTFWMRQTMHFLQQHVWSAEEVNIDAPGAVNPHENVRVIVVRGWR